VAGAEHRHSPSDPRRGVTEPAHCGQGPQEQPGRVAEIGPARLPHITHPADLRAGAAELAAWLRTRPPRAGRTRVVAVEGRSGAGKSTLADALAADLAAPVVRMDDLYEGWDGLLAGVDALMEWVIGPLAHGGPARWRRYDWAIDAYAEWHEVRGADALVVEGVGAGPRQAGPYLTGLVWLEAGEEIRRSRALARDGDLYAPHWERWAAQEERYYASHDVRSRADLVIHTE
jgi:cytidylate kinase